MMGPWAHRLPSTHAHTLRYAHKIRSIYMVPTMCWILQCYPDFCICKVQKSKRKLSEPWIVVWQSKLTWQQAPECMGAVQSAVLLKWPHTFPGIFSTTAFLLDIQTRYAMFRKTFQLDRHAHSSPTKACAHNETGALRCPDSEIITSFKTKGTAAQIHHLLLSSPIQTNVTYLASKGLLAACWLTHHWGQHRRVLGGSLSVGWRVFIQNPNVCN